jgi:hypothetical protein
VPLAVLALALASAPFWLGPSFAGHPLVAHTESGVFVYGDCESPPGEGGCQPPLQVQDRTTCERNPVALDVVPRRLYRLRGDAIAAVYARGTIDVYSTRTTTTVFARGDRLAARAAKALRRRGQARPRPLSAPAFPRAVLRELKRAVVAGDAARGIGPGVLRMRARLARLLPSGTLRGVPIPKRSWARVQHDRQIAFAAQAHQAQRRYGLTREQVRQAVRRVRGLTGSC